MIEYMYVLSILVTIMMPFILVAIVMYILCPSLREAIIKDWKGN